MQIQSCDWNDWLIAGASNSVASVFSCVAYVLCIYFLIVILLYIDFYEGGITVNNGWCIHDVYI